MIAGKTGNTSENGLMLWRAYIANISIKNVEKGKGKLTLEFHSRIYHFSPNANRKFREFTYIRSMLTSSL